MIGSINILVSLSNSNKKAVQDICENTLITSKVSIRHIARVLGRFSSSFLAVTLGRLHYRALERFKTEALTENKGNLLKGKRQPLLAIEYRRYNRFTFVENTITNSPKVLTGKFLGSNGLFCFISICKFSSFQNAFAMITGLPVKSEDLSFWHK